jgi:hypothetical protein
MQTFVFLLSLAHVIVLFASAIALSGFIVFRLGRWLWRIGAQRPAQKPVKRLRKVSPALQTRGQ